jgi:ATP/maltotriose-dependent transcriptional regulator MalT
MDKQPLPDLSKILDESFAIGEFAWLISAINEARKEAIEECAKLIEPTKPFETLESFKKLIKELK